jgi:crotonobetainyl-CoA:carnitine CoA-transferase CaiB-like acyl-CoA transferase
MYDYEGRGPFDEPSGRAVKGAHALYRSYQAADGWFFLAAERERLADLATVPELAGIAAVAEDRLEDWLAQRLRAKLTAYWVERLRALDVGAQPAETLARVREDNLVAESAGRPDLAGPTMAFVRHDPHPMGRAVDLVAPNAIRPRDARIVFPGPAPKYGAQSREVLTELGYGSDEIEALISNGVVSESWSRDYLPE